eukprot:g26131.t1
MSSDTDVASNTRRGEAHLKPTFIAIPHNKAKGVVSITDAVKACLTPEHAHDTAPETWKSGVDYMSASCLPYYQMFDIIHGMPLKTRQWNGWKQVKEFLNACMDDQESKKNVSLTELAQISTELTLQSHEIKRAEQTHNTEPTRNIRSLFKHFASADVDKVLPRFISSYMSGKDTYPASQEHVYMQLVGCVMDMHMKDKTIAQLNTQTPRSPPYSPPLVRTLFTYRASYLIRAHLKSLTLFGKRGGKERWVRACPQCFSQGVARQVHANDLCYKHCSQQCTECLREQASGYTDVYRDGVCKRHTTGRKFYGYSIFESHFTPYQSPHLPLHPLSRQLCISSFLLSSPPLSLCFLCFNISFSFLSFFFLFTLSTLLPLFSLPFHPFPISPSSPSSPISTAMHLFFSPLLSSPLLPSPPASFALISPSPSCPSSSFSPFPLSSSSLTFHPFQSPHLPLHPLSRQLCISSFLLSYPPLSPCFLCFNISFSFLSFFFLFNLSTLLLLFSLPFHPFQSPHLPLHPLSRQLCISSFLLSSPPLSPCFLCFNISFSFFYASLLFSSPLLPSPPASFVLISPSPSCLSSSFSPFPLSSSSSLFHFTQLKFRNGKRGGKERWARACPQCFSQGVARQVHTNDLCYEHCSQQCTECLREQASGYTDVYRDGVCKTHDWVWECEKPLLIFFKNRVTVPEPLLTFEKDSREKGSRETVTVTHLFKKVTAPAVLGNGRASHLQLTVPYYYAYASLTISYTTYTTLTWDDAHGSTHEYHIDIIEGGNIGWARQMNARKGRINTAVNQISNSNYQLTLCPLTYYRSPTDAYDRTVYYNYYRSSPDAHDRTVLCPYLHLSP